MAIDDDYLPISALNDLLFCERRCALHRTEQVWIDNQFTLEGTAAHRRVHAEPSSEVACDRGRVVRGLRLRSDRLRLVGVADLVEFVDSADGVQLALPVEYKRGRRRRWNNDDVQLCAQAICLEEVLGIVSPRGAIFHLRSRRRREILFDVDLRRRVESAARRLHELIESGQTPLPIVKPRCRGCSVRELCLPQTLERPHRAAAYVRNLFTLAEGEA